VFRDLSKYERRIFSQNGEDGVLARMLDLVGSTNQYFVEFGTGARAKQCCTRGLAELGWDGLWMDCCAPEEGSRVKRESVTAENINDLFAKYQVPNEFDVLSIDIDGNDYWVWKAIDEKYRPRIILAEYNASVPPTESRAIAYDPEFRWGHTDYYGASLLALARLAERRGYKLVYCDTAGVNAFFVRADLAGKWDAPVAELYRPANYRRNWLRDNLLPQFLTRLFRRPPGHPADPERRLVEVE
jgi:hypothetical protein